LQRLQVARHALQLLIALLELFFQPLLRTDCRRCLTHDPIGIDEADLALGERGLRQTEHGKGQQGEGTNFHLCLRMKLVGCWQSEHAAKLELEPLDIIVLFLLERMTEAELQRADR
jgi:hypothetical protein